MKKALEILIVITIIAGVAKMIFDEFDRRQTRTEVDAIKNNTETLLNYDSIISANEARFLDSVRVLREELTKAKADQHNENTKLRRQNQLLEKRFRAVDVGDRPDF